MDTLNCKLLQDALLEVALERIDEKMRHIKRDTSVSIFQARKMSAALGIKVHWRPSARQVIAILIAAAILALAGCGVVYRNEIRDFVVHFYETYIKMEYSKDNPPGTNEVVTYSFEYIQNGFEKNETKSKKNFFVWENELGQTISLSIQKINTSISYFDTENGDVGTIILNDVEIMTYKNDSLFSCIWNDGYKAFRLKMTGSIPEQDVFCFIEGIKRQ
ncbi:MAG: hypothetical protein IKP68_10235 [Clostridia bacterium]|nr:hypothetical protein [Clostridia bacterium]